MTKGTSNVLVGMKIEAECTSRQEPEFGMRHKNSILEMLFQREEPWRGVRVAEYANRRKVIAT